MRNVVLIISHKRPKCRTVKAILDAGYRGDWYIVCDDLDDTPYEELFPGHVIRFDKMEYVQKTDTVDNFQKLGSCTYARNACFDIAKRMGYDCFGVFDDDVSGFMYRYQDGNRLKSKPVCNFDAVFAIYCKYVLDADIACGSFVPAGRLIGGVQNPVVREKFYYNPTNVFIINTHKEQFPFIGTLRQDSIYSHLNNMLGRIVAAFMPIVVCMEPPGSMREGGIKETYSEWNNYVVESYSNIVIPSFFRWRNGIKEHTFSQNLPRVLNERWRKHAG